MPRRKGQAAQLAVQKEALNRWRILLRHPNFQKGLNRLRRRYRKWVKGPPITHSIFIFDETELPDLVVRKIRRKDVDLYEHECDLDDPMVGAAEGAWVDFNNKWGVNLPKGALTNEIPDLTQDTIEQWTAVRYNTPSLVPSPVEASHDRKNWLELKIDISYPRDVLIERIDKELLRAIEQRRAARQTRRRWDKLDYYLQVYDSAMRGETFLAIAKTLNKRVSTVKSAYLAIGKTIFGSARPTKEKLVLTDFNPATHVSQCLLCSKARTIDEMCAAARTYTNLDWRGQRDLPTEEPAKIRAVRVKGRKYDPDADPSFS